MEQKNVTKSHGISIVIIIMPKYKNTYLYILISLWMFCLHVCMLMYHVCVLAGKAKEGIGAEL